MQSCRREGRERGDLCHNFTAKRWCYYFCVAMVRYGRYVTLRRRERMNECGANELILNGWMTPLYTLATETSKNVPTISDTNIWRAPKSPPGWRPVQQGRSLKIHSFIRSQVVTTDSIIKSLIFVWYRSLQMWCGRRYIGRHETCIPDEWKLTCVLSESWMLPPFKPPPTSQGRSIDTTNMQLNLYK